MPEYLAPGVYVEEVSSGPPPIAGVGTTTTGLIGVTRRGPTEGPPTLVTNYSEFVRTFGGPFDFGAAFADYQDLPYAVKGFFANGGRRLYVSRVVAAATAATPPASASVALTGGMSPGCAATWRSAPPCSPLVTTRGLRIASTRPAGDGQATGSRPPRPTSPITPTTGRGRRSRSRPPCADRAFEARYTTVLDRRRTLVGAGSPGRAGQPGIGQAGVVRPDRGQSTGTWGRDMRSASPTARPARSWSSTPRSPAATPSYRSPRPPASTSAPGWRSSSARPRASGSIARSPRSSAAR